MICQRYTWDKHSTKKWEGNDTNKSHNNGRKCARICKKEKMEKQGKEGIAKKKIHKKLGQHKFFDNSFTLLFSEARVILEITYWEMGTCPC